MGVYTGSLWHADAQQLFEHDMRGIRDGYGGLVLGYNSDAEAAHRAQHFLEERFDVKVHCIKVGV